MGQPSNIAGYEPEWALIAQHLTTNSSLTLPIGNAKQAASFRFRFYGFRKAMARHDPANPWLAALMETQATITPTGDVHLERAPFSAVLRGLLEHSVIKAPQTHESENDSPVPGIIQRHEEVDTAQDTVDGVAKHDETILSVLSRHK